MRPFTIRCLLLLALLATTVPFVDGWLYEPPQRPQTPPPRRLTLKEASLRMHDWRTLNEVESRIGPPHDVVWMFDAWMAVWQDKDGRITMLVNKVGDYPVFGQRYLTNDDMKREMTQWPSNWEL